jgi:hypothetical protein
MVTVKTNGAGKEDRNGKESDTDWWNWIEARDFQGYKEGN